MQTNQQYYQGAQPFVGITQQTDFTTTFNTDLVFGNASPNQADYALNNFKLYEKSNWLTWQLSRSYFWI